MSCTFVFGGEGRERGSEGTAKEGRERGSEGTAKAKATVIEILRDGERESVRARERERESERERIFIDNQEVIEGR